MSLTSCVRNPEKNRYIQLHEWQVKFCQGNHCAALILAYFIAWHDWKIRNDQYYRKSNDIAEIHGDGRPHNEKAYLFFNTEELIDGCMGLYGKKAISDGLEVLVQLGVISLHKNPNPRYHFDKTKYFQFYPQVCNRWIADNYPINGSDYQNDIQTVDYSDSTKIAYRKSENVLPSCINSQPSSKSSQAITNTTYNTTNKNKQTKAGFDFIDAEKPNPMSEKLIEPVVELLIEKGMPSHRLRGVGDLALLTDSVKRGATAAHFAHAYEIAFKATSARNNQFGVRYLIKVVADLMQKEASSNVRSNNHIQDNKTDYENDFNSGLSWMGDLIK